jgi:hypothetical protein
MHLSLNISLILLRPDYFGKRTFLNLNFLCLLKIGQFPQIACKDVTDTFIL